MVIRNENQLTIFKKFENNKQLFHKIDAIIDNCYRDCHHNFYHTFEYEGEYDFNLRNITNKETHNLTISSKSMNLYVLNKKITVA